MFKYLNGLFPTYVCMLFNAATQKGKSHKHTKWTHTKMPVGWLLYTIIFSIQLICSLISNRIIYWFFWHSRAINNWVITNLSTSLPSSSFVWFPVLFTIHPTHPHTHNVCVCVCAYFTPLFNVSIGVLVFYRQQKHAAWQQYTISSHWTPTLACHPRRHSWHGYCERKFRPFNFSCLFQQPIESIFSFKAIAIDHMVIGLVSHCDLLSLAISLSPHMKLRIICL